MRLCLHHPCSCILLTIQNTRQCGCTCRDMIPMLIYRCGGILHSSLNTHNLCPPYTMIWSGHIHSNLHFCSLSSHFCFLTPQHDERCAVLLLADDPSGFISGLHNTRSTSPSSLQTPLILHLLACLWPLSLPESMPWAYKAALPTERIKTLAFYSTAVVQHTLPCWPHWFCQDTITKTAKDTLTAVSVWQSRPKPVPGFSER